MKQWQVKRSEQRCPNCGRWVVKRVWHSDEGKVITQIHEDKRLSPVEQAVQRRLGLLMRVLVEHVCPEVKEVKNEKR